MKLLFNKIDITKYLLDFSMEISLNTIFTTSTFSLPFEIVKKHNLGEGLDVEIETNNLSFSGKCIKFKDKNNEICTFTAVSMGWYLSVHEETFQVNASGKEVIREIIRAYNEKLRVEINSDDFSIEIKKIYFDKSLEEIINDIFLEISSKTGKDYYLINTNEILKVINRLEEVEINLRDILAIEKSVDISKVKNQIKVIAMKENNVETSVLMKDTESIKKLGLIQEVHKIKSEDIAKGKREGEKLLKLNSKEKREISLELKGGFIYFPGKILKLNNNKFLVKSVKHNIKNGLFTSSLVLEDDNG